MIPDLKPDIYRCIGKHLAPTTASTRLDNDAKNDTKAYQQNLLNLMKSFKVSSFMFDSSKHYTDFPDTVQCLRSSAVHQLLRREPIKYLHRSQQRQPHARSYPTSSPLQRHIQRRTYIHGVDRRADVGKVPPTWSREGTMVWNGGDHQVCSCRKLDTNLTSTRHTSALPQASFNIVGRRSKSYLGIIDG